MEENIEYEQSKLINFLCKSEKLIKAYKELLVECIMYSKINFYELPQTLRVSDYVLYTTAFRVSYNDCQKSINMLKCVIKDYRLVCEETDSQRFITIFSFYYQVINERFSGVPEYECFKKTIPRDILRKLQV